MTQLKHIQTRSEKESIKSLLDLADWAKKQ